MEKLLNIVKDNNLAKLKFVCAGKVVYEIITETAIYQLEIDTTTDEFKTTYLFPEEKAIHLMRWIRKGIENNDDTFILLKTL